MKTPWTKIKKGMRSRWQLEMTIKIKLMGIVVEGLKTKPLIRSFQTADFLNKGYEEIDKR